MTTTWIVRSGIEVEALEKTLNELASAGLIVRHIFIVGGKTFTVCAHRDKTLRELYAPKVGA